MLDHKDCADGGQVDLSSRSTETNASCKVSK